MNDELRKLFMDVFCENHTASIQAEIDKDGGLVIHIEGRGIELLVLSLKIAEKVGKDLKLSKKDYIEILQEGWKEDSDKKDDIPDMFKKIFDDLIK